MSWDVFVCRFSRTYAHLDQVGNDESCQPMGSRAEVHATIARHFGQTDWSDPTWGSHRGPFGSVEFSIGEHDPVESIMLHVRAGSGIVAPIVALCLERGWQALDQSTGLFLEQAAVPEEGLEQWRAYRDQLLG